MLNDDKRINILKKIQKDNKHCLKIFLVSNSAVRYLMGQSPLSLSLTVTIHNSLPNKLKSLINQYIDDIDYLKCGDFLHPTHSELQAVINNPFVLDTILISIDGKIVIDPYNAISDINDKLIKMRFTGPAHHLDRPSELLYRKPPLMLRAAALVAETGFRLDDSIYMGMTRYKNFIEEKELGKNEFFRLLKAEQPSRGIVCLQETGILQKILPELADCFGVGQNPKYHKYDVFKHCLRACDSCEWDNLNIRFAALIHDIGKPIVKAVTYKEGNVDNITFHKHEVVGAKLAKLIVKRSNINNVDASEIIHLVSNHMYQYDRRWKTSTVRKFIERVGLTVDYIDRLDEFPLFKLRCADRLGRGLNPVTQKQMDFQARLNKELKKL